MTTTQTWLLIGLLAASTAVTKGAGPLMSGDRPLPPAAARLVVLLAPALLAALVATQVLTDGTRLRLGAVTVGALVAVGLVLARVHLLVVVVSAAAVTAALRWVGLP